MIDYEKKSYPPSAGALKKTQHLHIFRGNSNRVTLAAVPGMKKGNKSGVHCH
jgi:hypothetical protein